MPYHESGGNITWADCTLRSWLHHNFYKSLPEQIKSRVAEVVNQNQNNAEYGTAGGKPTKDKVFLLSLDEVNKYFSSGQERIAKYEGSDFWWWLRSPGGYAGHAALVIGGGGVYASGYDVDYDSGGVRPALWLNL
ncbi:MAG: DUF6273 domain-containing protein [Eggerthellaceae bacterium]|jgi:hypothetical protein|nr:DUF6273 domain-containing protein [Eggerthellaceae bacterium]